jgi:hypothetical protein
MVEDVELPYSGMRLDNDTFLDPTLLKILSHSKISRLLSHAKRVMQTVG